MSDIFRRMQSIGRAGVSAGAILLASLFPVLSTASVASAVTAPQWNLVGNFDITFSCLTGCGGIFPHAMIVATENFSTGDFSGTGKYITDPSYTWDMTGSTNGNNVTFTIVYTGTLAGQTFIEDGTIDENGHMSGTAHGSGSTTFTWDAVSGTASEVIGNGVKPEACTGNYTNVIHGTNGKDKINGTAGNDLIFGYGGNDVINGGSGEDCIVGGLGDDSINGGSGNDVIYGNGGNDTLNGSSGNDTVYGGYGNDKLVGSTGQDSLTGDTGTDNANGGTGIDTCSAETQVSC